MMVVGTESVEQGMAPDRQRRTYLALLGIALLAVLAAIIVTSLREYSWAGTISLLLLSVLWTGLAITLTGFPAVTLTAIALAFAGFEAADRVKMTLLGTHLQLPDLSLMLDLAGAGDLGIALEYWEVTGGTLIVSVLCLVVLAAVVRLERRQRPPVDRLSRLAGAAVLAMAAGIGSWLFMSSHYIGAIRLQHVNRMAIDPAGPRVSVSAVAAMAYLNLVREIRAGDAAAFAGEAPTACGSTCPDLIIVHMESVFDPRFTRPFAASPWFGERLASGSDGLFGLMRANVWGGFSWVTEFEILCGMNHALFGWAGRYTHYNVAPLLRGCLGTELKRMGYDTTTLYSMSAVLINVGNAFKRYGIDRFLDARALDLPALRLKIRDGVMVDKLIAELERPSDKPRFFWLSTIWNHGPHRRGLVKETFPGPYDPALTEDPAYADYLNRLNDSLSAFQRLKAYADTSNHPIAIMFYGDHHPYFAKTYDPTVTARLGDNPDFLTPLAFVRNAAAGGQAQTPRQLPSIVRAEDTALAFLNFAGVPEPPGLAALRAVSQTCGGEQLKCTDEARRRLLNVYGGS